MSDMDENPPNALELQLMQLLRDGAFEEVATLTLRAYSSELYGFLSHVMRGSPAAADVLSQTTEDFWRSLPTFRAQCRFRTWLYLLARHAVERHRRSPWNRSDRFDDAKLDALVALAHSRTAPWQRTDIKDKWRELRETLTLEDRELLVLRVDRGLEWREIARIVIGASDPDAASLRRGADRLRKQFQSLKERLQALARAAGLVDSVDSP